jgi:outer membrane protein assembly factor BamB
MAKQMLSEHIPIKMFNALTHEDGDTIDHTSEGESAADIETLATEVQALEDFTGIGSKARSNSLDTDLATSEGLVAKHESSYTLHKLNGTTAPKATDDLNVSTPGYSAGSIWVDVTNDKAYICLDASDGAAIWQPVETALNNFAATGAPTIADDLNVGYPGYSAGSLWVDVTNDVGYVCLDASNGAAIWQPFETKRNNYAASAAPAVTDDVNVDYLGYSVGSKWFDTTNDKAYVCLDNSNGAAVWKEIDTTLNNFAAAAAPAVTDDINVSTPGYTVGSKWFDTTNDKAYICIDNSNGAAIWKEINTVKNNYVATAAPAITDDLDVSNPGYSVGSTWIDVTNDKAYICLDATNGAAIWQPIETIRNNYAGTTAPAVTDDLNVDYLGYQVGSIWNDTTNDISYICLDNSNGAAVWKRISYAVVDNLAGTGSVEPLAANQGFVIDGRLDALEAITAETGAPTMAVAASKILTIGTKPAEGAIVTIGTTNYKFRASALGAGVKATGTLDMTADAPHAGDTVIAGAQTYTYVTALTAPAVPNEILVEATSAAAIDNLVAAIMDGAGEGTKYGTGTVTQETVVTAARTDNTMTVEYAIVGFAGNAYDTAGTLTHGSWGAAYLAGGIDAQAANDVYDGGDIENSIINLEKAIEDSGTEGTHYGTGTTEHPDVSVSAKDGTTMTITAKVKGIAGNSFALAETLADGSWNSPNADFMRGGVPGTTATAGKIRYEATKIWIAVTTCTVSDSTGWKYSTLT